MKKTLEVIAAAAFACVAFLESGAGTPPKIDLPRKPKDGMGDVNRASKLGEEGKWKEGRSFIAELRARPANGRNLEECQSVNMAEFALLRHDLKANKARAVECLKAVYDAGCTSFWGWAAYSYLKEYGVDVPQPPKDPLRGLGAFGDGVVNLEPRFLEPVVGSRVSNGDWAKNIRQPAFDSRNLKSEDLKPGSSVRRALLRKRLVEICGEKKIGEILAAKGGRELFARLWNDDAVLEDFLLSGPVFDAPLALETLMTLFLNDEDEKWSCTEMGRRATVAVAINAQKGDDMTATVRHWAAFRRIGKVGGFVTEAAKRDCREWRFIVKRPSDAAETLYLNAQRRFPTRYLANVSIRNVPYRKKNCFGVSKWAKHDEYMRPWTVSGWPRLYLRSRVGGVCVELSEWASRAANAQGIMAVTNFQPGRKATKFRKGAPAHRCWAMRKEDGNWRLINGIRPYSGASFTLWGKGFQYLQATERAFADRAAHDESELLRFAGCLREAAIRCPYNISAWRAYTESLKKSDATIDDWRRYLADLVRLAPDGRLVSWNFSHEALDAMATKKEVDRKGLAKETARVFFGLPQPKGYIAEEMNFEKDALELALKRFKGFPTLEDGVLAAALIANMDSGNYLPQTFGYAIRQFGKDKERLGRFFGKVMRFLDGNGGTRSTGTPFAGKIDWRRLCSVKGCMEDRMAFRMMSDFRNEEDPPTGAAKVTATDYGVPLASYDALVATSSAGKGDTPEDYARVSDETPYDPARKGLFVTKAEEAPFVVVELAGQVVVKGVTAIGAERPLTVWMKGEEDDWKEVGGGAPKAGVLRIDLNGNPQTVKSVKVGFKPEDGKNVLRLNKVLVYGERLF